jgi:hypothetical protein
MKNCHNGLNCFFGGECPQSELPENWNGLCPFQRDSLTEQLMAARSNDGLPELRVIRTTNSGRKVYALPE